MALTNAEKIRAHRERQRIAREQSPDVTEEFLRTSIAERYAQRGSFDFEETLDALGYENRASFADEVPDFLSGASISFSGRPALERLSALAGAFLDAARELHAFVNTYKVDEINARIAELEADASIAPEIKALAIGRLTDIRARLEKEFRRGFPEIAVKGK